MSASELLAPGQHWDGLKVVDNPHFTALPEPAAKVRPAPPTVDEVFFSRVVAAAQQAFWGGMPVTVEALIMADSTLEGTRGHIADLLVLPKFLNALADRGVLLSHSQGLTPAQISAVHVYFSAETPGLSHEQKLKLAGVTDSQWRGWMRGARFGQFVSSFAEALLRDAQPVALQRIAEAVDRGERWAIELDLEVTGRHDRREKSVDIGEVLMSIYAILDDEIGDSALLGRISDRVKSMLGGGAPVMQIAPAVREPQTEEQ